MLANYEQDAHEKDLKTIKREFLRQILCLKNPRYIYIVQKTTKRSN
jgi:hypothetical protein